MVDFLALNQALVERCGCRITALALDANFIRKSGKATFGLDKFWNGCASRAEKGLGVSLIALVNARRHASFALTLDQTEPQHETLSGRRQCTLLGLNRAGYYYQPAPESTKNLLLLRLLDEQYLARPIYGSRRLTWYLRQSGHQVNRKRVQRLTPVLGLEALAPKPPKTSVAHPAQRIYPYLLRGLAIVRPNPRVVCRHHLYPHAARIYVSPFDH